MWLIKRFLLVILLLVGVGAGLVIASRYVPNEKWNGVTLSPTQFQPLIASSMEKVGQNQIGQRVGEFRSKVLGVQTQSPSSVDASESSDTNAANVSSQPEESVAQKTLDFARYSYCQEVVRVYEAKQK